jgi:hypothetical protein
LPRHPPKDVAGLQSGVIITFALPRNGSSTAESVIAPRRQPLKPFGLGEQNSPQPTLNLAF